MSESHSINSHDRLWPPPNWATATAEEAITAANKSELYRLDEQRNSTTKTEVWITCNDGSEKAEWYTKSVPGLFKPERVIKKDPDSYPYIASYAMKVTYPDYGVEGSYPTNKFARFILEPPDAYNVGVSAEYIQAGEEEAAHSRKVEEVLKGLADKNALVITSLEPFSLKQRTAGANADAILTLGFIIIKNHKDPDDGTRLYVPLGWPEKYGRRPVHESDTRPLVTL